MRGFLKFSAWTLGILTVICLILYFALFDVWTVPSGNPHLTLSIMPTLGEGDVVITMRKSGGERGDLLKCADPDPQYAGQFLIGRLEGKSGEKIDINGEVPSIDGSRTPSPSACDPAQITLKNPDTDEDVELRCSIEELGSVRYEALRAATRTEPPSKLVVDEGKVYLLSDNRHMHLDSRDYGTIDPSTCKHIVFRLWSKDGFGDSKHRFNFLL
jgi:signal peptidase I